MRNRSTFGVLLLLLLGLQACVADQQQLQNQNALLQDELKHFQLQLYEAEQRIQSQNAEIERLQQAENTCSQNLTDLETQNTSLKNINLKLTQKVERLSGALEKNKSVIKLQNKVIGLLDDTKKTIATSLKDEIAAQQIELVETEDTLKVIFVDKILFDSGSVKINAKGQALLLAFAESIRQQNDQCVLVEGHTDSMPLGPSLKARFPSNWELSVARAAAVTRFLQIEGQLQPQRLSARGYSYYRPVASNETIEGRHQNRRIEIILSPTEQSR
ncbi:MAG: flagellar motor protein MotB [Deltaproteobacteria bacterium]|jgi:chemotaxis protein MotB|nr:flagellar motor protein MotB [Deltaproteobacteria bacterium]